MLLQRRSPGGAHGGLWEFPGGKLENGESPEQAAVREIAEELGVAIDQDALHPVGFASAAGPTGRAMILLLYACRSWRGEPRCLGADATQWFAAEALQGLAMPPLDIPLIASLTRFL